MAPGVGAGWLTVSDRPLRIWLPAVRAGSGADVFVERLADALRREGHEPLPQWFDHRHELMPWRLARMPAPARVDLVHAGSWQAFAFRRPGLPLVVTEHQYVAHPAFLPHRRMLQAAYHRFFIVQCMRLSYRRADALVAVSRHVASAMRKDWHGPIEVIHNWVDVRRFSPPNTRPCRSGRPFRLLFVGNPSRWKGADLLPDIAARLGEGFEILCLGGLRRSFEGVGLPANMTLLPRVAPERMPSVYHSVDAALVPARYEAFGYVTLEAMACGLPVLGFDCAGTAEVAVHGETALLAPLEDVNKLLCHARRLAEQPDLCERLGKAGRARAEALFDESRAMAAYLRTYCRVLAGRL